MASLIETAAHSCACVCTCVSFFLIVSEQIKYVASVYVHVSLRNSWCAARRINTVCVMSYHLALRSLTLTGEIYNDFNTPTGC